MIGAPVFRDSILKAYRKKGALLFHPMCPNNVGFRSQSGFAVDLGSDRIL